MFNVELNFTELNETMKAVRMAMGNQELWASLNPDQKRTLESVEDKLEVVL